jgi:hypothetical protein
MRTTVRDPKRESASDLGDRDFVRSEPNRLWVGDLKYIQTGQSFLFLAAVQDVFSRRIIGWSMRDDLKSDLVLDALGMAVTARGDEAAGVVAHSDQGSQYASLVYGAYAKQSRIDLSMGSIATRRTTHSPRASSPRSRKSSSAANASRRASGPGSGSSGTSNASTTRAAGTPASACSARSTPNGDTNRRPRCLRLATKGRDRFLYAADTQPSTPVPAARTTRPEFWRLLTYA